MLHDRPDHPVSLDQWYTLQPELEDQLIVEQQTRKDWWEAVGRIPIRLRPVVHECKLHGRTLELHAFAPLGAVWRIIESDGVIHEHSVLSSPLQVQLLNQKLWVCQTITVHLLCGQYTYTQQLEYVPNEQEWLESELRFGIGWGQLSNEVITDR